MLGLGKPSRASVLIVAFVVSACSSSSSTSGTSSGGSAGGDEDCKVGVNAPFAKPTGTAFALPTGIELSGEISGDIEAGCASEPVVEKGGDLLPICLPLKNTTGADITVKIPAGLTFIAANAETQNGIVLQAHELLVPAQSSVVFHFRLFCLNEHCVFGSKSDRFTFGNVTDHPGVLEIIGLARTKVLDGGVSAYVFGQLLWDVTDHQGVTDAHRALLADVPDT